MKNKYTVNGDYTLLHVPYKDAVVDVKIDTEDLKKVSSIKGYWRIEKKGKRFYVQTTINRGKGGGRVRLWLHRLIMNTPDHLVTDHIDHNTLDNRKNNLRVCSDCLNSSHKEGAKHYTAFRDGYRVRVRKKDIKIDKRFDTEEEAERYAQLVRQLIFMEENQ